MLSFEKPTGTKPAPLSGAAPNMMARRDPGLTWVHVQVEPSLEAQISPERSR